MTEMSHAHVAAEIAARSRAVPRDRSAVRARVRALLLTIAAVAVPLGLWAWVAVETRRHTIDNAEAANRAVTAAITEHTLRLLEGQAFVLGLLDRAAGPRACPALRADAGLQSFATDIARRAPQTDAIWVMDATGRFCISNDPARVDDRDRSFREYFVRARDRGPGGFVVDRAIVGLARGQPIFDLARAREVDGKFAGIVLASVSLTDLVAHWKAVASPVPTQRIALFRLDGATIARSWEPLVPEPNPAQEARIAETLGRDAEGTRIGPSNIDGSRRVAAWHAIPEWGVIVSTSVALDAVLQPWWRATVLYGAIALLTAGLLLALTRSVRRSQLRLERTNAGLQDQVAARTASLRRLNADLETRVRDAVAATEAAQVRAAQAERMQALGQLAGGIAHDLNNVLQAVQGGALLIERRAGGLAEVTRLSKMVLDATGRGAAITRRLLSFARRGDLRAEPVDAAGLLESLHEILSHALGAGIFVRVEAAEKLPPLLADKGQLETVLVNLATNARDAMPGGGILTLAAVADPGRAVELADGEYIRLDVRDGGAGMDPATLDRATEPFFTTKPAGQGTGLGLAMARGFAEQSGGRLAIESAPGQGTTVRLWLPVARPAIASPAETTACVVASRAGKILLVDDEALVRETLAEQMRDAGFSVVVAADAAEALDRLDQDSGISALVSDLAMPGMDGIALTRIAQSRRPDLPAVLLTGFAGDGTGSELALSGLLGGRFALLRKPVPGEVLAERVGALLAGRPI